MQILVLSREDVLLLHDLILTASTGKPGILHENHIDAALLRPFTYMQYEEVTMNTVAALLIDSFARNHAFYDGNKRTSLMCAIYTYAINGIFLQFDRAMNEEFENLVLWVVNEKPTIHSIEKCLEGLVNKYRRGTFSGFLDSFREFFIP